MSSELKNIIESLMMVSEVPLSVSKIQGVFENDAAPSADDVKAAIKGAEKKMANVIFEQQHPAAAEHSKGSKSDGLIKKTEATGDEVVDLLQSKGRGKNGIDDHLLHPKSSKSKSKKSKKSRRGFS